jgi:PAS domain S-box-containing protein
MKSSADMSACNTAPTQAPADRAPPDQDRRSLRKNAKSLILVVDDTPTNLQLMQSILELAEYEVITASNGPSALVLAQSAQPQLILLDVMMPGMDGYAVCSQLKANAATRHIPVIFVTAVDDAESETRGFALGAADYITKPIRVPVVLARVKAHMALYGQRRRLEGMFRDVMEFAPDAFILADMQGNILHINARAEQLFGYRREELIGVQESILIPLRLRPEHGHFRASYLQQPLGRMTGISLQCLRKNGSEFPCDINLSSLETNRGRLLMAVVRDVSAHQKAEQALSESQQRLRELAAQTEAMRENERKHIAREVHDELGQVLTALRMDMSLLGMRYGTQNPALLDKLTGMKGLVDRAIQGVRNVAVNLRPAALDMGLVPAIEWLCSEFTERTAVPCQLHTLEENISLDETRNVVLFRIAQESLTNIVRYARASQVDVALGHHGNALWLEVRDNGCGFDMAAAAEKKSFGLLGMRERALALGGELEIRSTQAQGTLIRVTIPIDNPNSKDAP